MSSWRWYHIALVWIVALVGSIALFRANAQVFNARSESGGLVGVGVPLSLIGAYAVLLITLVVITSLWMKSR